MSSALKNHRHAIAAQVRQRGGRELEQITALKIDAAAVIFPGGRVRAAP